MSDEAAPARTVKIAGTPTAITEPTPVSVSTCDVIIDLRVVDGMVWLTMGSWIMDGSGPAEARVTTRQRMPLSVFHNVQIGVTTAAEADKRPKREAN